MNQTLQALYNSALKSNKSDSDVQYTLDDLMSQVTAENLHERANFGNPVGNELLT